VASTTRSRIGLQNACWLRKSGDTGEVVRFRNVDVEVSPNIALREEKISLLTLLGAEQKPTSKSDKVFSTFVSSC